MNRKTETALDNLEKAVWMMRDTLRSEALTELTQLGQDMGDYDVVWDGESMPAIGLKVMYLPSDDAVEVMAHGAAHVFCGKDNEGFLGLFDWHSCEPIKSDRDRAIEAAEPIANAKCWTKDILGALYDAGLLRLPGDK